MTQAVAHDDLRADVREKRLRRPDAERRDVEMVDVAARLDELSDDRGLADSRLPLENDVPGRKIIVPDRLVDRREHVLAADEVARAFLDERRELLRPDLR